MLVLLVLGVLKFKIEKVISSFIFLNDRSVVAHGAVNFYFGCDCMRYVITNEQGRACMGCPWRDRRLDNIIVCPRAVSCENVRRVYRKPGTETTSPAAEKNESL